MESCGGQDKLCVILYLTGNEHFLVTTPIGNPIKSDKGGWVNVPALHPAAILLARYSMMTSGWSKANFQLPKTMLVLFPSKPIFMPCSMLWSSLLHQAWSAWFARSLQKLLRCSGDWATKTTSGSRVLLLTIVTHVCSFAIGECAYVQLEVITAFSPIAEPFVQLCGWGGLGWTWFNCLPWLHALLHNLHHLQQGSLGKGTPVYQMVEAPASEAFVGWGLNSTCIENSDHQGLVHGGEGEAVVGAHWMEPNVVHLDCRPDEFFVLLHDKSFCSKLAQSTSVERYKLWLTGTRPRLKATYSGSQYACTSF